MQIVDIFCIFNCAFYAKEQVYIFQLNRKIHFRKTNTNQNFAKSFLYLPKDEGGLYCFLMRYTVLKIANK